VDRASYDDVKGKRRTGEGHRLIFYIHLGEIRHCAGRGGGRDAILYSDIISPGRNTYKARGGKHPPLRLSTVMVMMVIMIGGW
jgi:hypothetical protein